MLRDGKKVNVGGGFLNEEQWSRRKKSVVTVLPPSIDPVPLINSTTMRRESTVSGGSRRESVSRQRTSLSAARRQSMALDSNSLVYVVDPTKNDPVAREQKERLLQAIMRYQSPRPHADSDSKQSNDDDPYGELEDTLDNLHVQKVNSSLTPFRAFEDADTPNRDEDGQDRSIADEASAEPTSPLMPNSELTSPASPPAARAFPHLKSLPVPSLHFPGGPSPRISSRKAAAEQRRKSLKSIMEMPGDVLSSLGGVEETLAALDDDKKLLGLEEQYEAIMSARKTSRQHRNVMDHFRSDATMRSVSLPPIPEIPMVNFDDQLQDVLRQKNPFEAINEMLRVVEDTVRAMHIDIATAVSKEVGKMLDKQRDESYHAIEAFRKIVNQVIIPKSNEQAQQIRELTDDLAAEKRAVQRQKSEMTKIQSAMRQFGVVPSKWGVVPPLADSACILCCDFPIVPALWDADPVTTRNSVKLVLELSRKIMKEMKAGYEANNDGVSMILVFSSPKSSLDWALSFQSQLLGLSWPEKLLSYPTCEQDAKLLYRGLRARVVVHRGHLMSEFDPSTQTTIYYGEALRTASAMMQYCSPGVILASDEVTNICGDFKELATHGGAYPQPFTVEVEGGFHMMMRLVPNALKGRLELPPPAHHNVASAHGLTCEANFLGYTLRPSDIFTTGDKLMKSGSCLDNLRMGECSDLDDTQVAVARAFIASNDAEEDIIKQLQLCVNTMNLTDNVLTTLRGAERSGIFVCTVSVQIADAVKAFSKHRASFIPTVRTLAGCVRKSVKGLTSGTDISCVGETVSLIFASRTETFTFLERLLKNFYSSVWHEDTIAGWAAAFPAEKRPTPEIVVGAHYGTITDYSKFVDNGSFTMQHAMTFDDNESGSFGTQGGHSDAESSLMLNGYARNFDVSCALAAFAYPGEVIISQDLAESGNAASFAEPRGLSLAGLGIYSIQNPRYEGELFSVALNPPLHKQGKSTSFPAVRSSVAAERSRWPSSKMYLELCNWLPSLQEIHSANQRAMTLLQSERNNNMMIKAPAPKDCTFVAVEAFVPLSMWRSPKKYLILEALRSFQRCVRGVLVELGAGYEVFTEPQSFFVAFPSPITAIKFSLTMQDKLTQVFWTTAFVEEFKEHVKRASAPSGEVVWSGLRTRVAVVSQPPQSSTSANTQALEVFADTLPTGVTSFFGRTVKWCVQLCAMARFGEILVDQETSNAVQSSFSALGNPQLKATGTISLPERPMPTKVFTVSSSMLRYRQFDMLPQQYSDQRSFASWFIGFTKEDSPVQYVLSSDTEIGRIMRQESLARSEQFVIPEFQMYNSVLRSPKFGAFGASSTSPRTASPDPAQLGHSLNDVAANIMPIPINLAVTPRQRRTSEGRLSPNAIDPEEHRALQEELQRVHKIVKRLLEFEQQFVRAYVLKESMRSFKSEDEFLRTFVQSLKELGVKWIGSGEKADKAFLSLCNSVIASEIAGVRRTVSMIRDGAMTPTQSGGATPIGKKDPTAAEISSSIAGMLCNFHNFIARGIRTLSRRGSMGGADQAAPLDSMMTKRKSMELPSRTPRTSLPPSSSNETLSHTASALTEVPSMEGSYDVRRATEDIGARAVESNSDDDDD